MSAPARTPPTRASLFRTLSVVLAFTAAVGLVFGTAGFTAMEADRGFAVNVTDDESGYLGYEPIADETPSGTPTAVVEYRNQFGSDLGEFDVDVSIARSAATTATIQSVDPPSSLDRGRAEPVAVTLRCQQKEEVPLVFEADGERSGLTVSLDRTHTVTCIPRPTVTSVEFDDAANGQVLVDDEDGAVPATVWIVETPPAEAAADLTAVSFDEAAPLDTAEKIRPQVVDRASVTDAGNNWKVIAVSFPDQNATYVHPGWDAGDYETPSSGDGVVSHQTLDKDRLLNATVEDGALRSTR